MTSTVNLLDQLPEEARQNLKKMQMPSVVQPMLATLTHDYFSREGWIFERKFDGERCLAFRKGHEVKLLSRNEAALNDTYPEIADAIAESSDHDSIVDGEIVAFEGSVTSFSRLQQRMQLHGEEARAKGVEVFYYLFDLLFLDGFDTSGLALHYRKNLLEQALEFRDPLRFTEHRETEGEAYLREACRKGWEGLIAKRADSTYISTRSRDWLKFKCVHEQEFVIGGYTDPGGSRVGFGALLVGYYEDGEFRYAGKVGTGYDEHTLKDLGKKLEERQQDTKPFEDRVSAKGVHWVRPELVAQIGFTEWTSYGKLRHPRYLGLRRDKKPEEVTREVA